jgi:hypothetical protein
MKYSLLIMTTPSDPRATIADLKSRLAEARRFL